MDWSKVKTILITIFLALNIFLAYNLFIQESNTVVISASDITNIKSILKQKNIELTGALKTKIKPKSALMVENISYNEKVLVNSFFGDIQSPVKNEKLEQKTVYSIGENEKVLEIYSNKRMVYKNNNPNDNFDYNNKDIMNDIENKLKEYGVYPEYAKVNKKYSNNGVHYIQYKQVYNGNEIFVSYMNVKATDKGITEIDKYWINPVQLDKTSKDMVKTPVQILLAFAKDFGSSEKIIIEDVTEGYYFPISNYTNASFSATPAWKIQTSNGNIYYYNGYEGYLENTDNFID